MANDPPSSRTVNANKRFTVRRGHCGSIVCQDWTLSNSTSWRNWSANCWRIRGTRERPATELTLREVLIVASGYVRNNITEEIWAEIFDVDQSTISRYITYLTPLTGKATAGVPAIRGGGSKDLPQRARARSDPQRPGARRVRR